MCWNQKFPHKDNQNCSAAGIKMLLPKNLCLGSFQGDFRSIKYYSLYCINNITPSMGQEVNSFPLPKGCGSSSLRVVFVRIPGFLVFQKGINFILTGRLHVIIQVCTTTKKLKLPECSIGLYLNQDFDGVFQKSRE